MQKPIRVKIDTVANCSVEIDKNIVKGDTLLMTINIYQEMQSLNLANQDIHIIIRTADGCSVEMKSGNPLLSVNGTQITAQFKDDWLATGAAGRAMGEIHLIDSSGDDITNKFYFDIDSTLADDIITKSKDTIDTLIQLKKLIDESNLNVNDLQAVIDAAKQQSTILTGINNNAGNLAARVENDISIATPLAVRLEADNTNGLTIANRVEMANSNGTVTENKLQLATTNGNEVLNQLKNLNWTSSQSWIHLMETMVTGLPLTDEFDSNLTDEFDQVLTM